MGRYNIAIGKFPEVVGEPNLDLGHLPVPPEEYVARLMDGRGSKEALSGW